MEGWAHRPWALVRPRKTPASQDTFAHLLTSGRHCMWPQNQRSLGGGGTGASASAGVVTGGRRRPQRWCEHEDDGHDSDGNGAIPCTVSCALSAHCEPGSVVGRPQHQHCMSLRLRDNLWWGAFGAPITKGETEAQGAMTTQPFTSEVRGSPGAGLSPLPSLMRQGQNDAMARTSPPGPGPPHGPGHPHIPSEGISQAARPV